MVNSAEDSETPLHFPEEKGEGGAAALAPTATLLLNAATRRMLVPVYRASGESKFTPPVVVRELWLKPVQGFFLLYHYAVVLGSDFVA